MISAEGTGREDHRLLGSFDFGTQHRYVRPSIPAVLQALWELPSADEKVQFLQQLIKVDEWRGALREGGHGEWCVYTADSREWGRPEDFDKASFDEFERRGKSFRGRLSELIDTLMRREEQDSDGGEAEGRAEFLFYGHGREEHEEDKQPQAVAEASSIYWNGPQDLFGAWLYASYHRYMRSKTGEEDYGWERLVDRIGPLFYRSDKGNNKPMTLDTIKSNSSKYYNIKYRAEMDMLEEDVDRRSEEAGSPNPAGAA